MPASTSQRRTKPKVRRNSDVIYFMTALRRPDKLRRFRDGMCAVVGMVRKKKNMELQWGRSIAAGAVDCWKRGMNDQQ